MGLFPNTEGHLSPQQAAIQTFSVCAEINILSTQPPSGEDVLKRREELFHQLHGLIEYTAYSPIAKQKLVEKLFSETGEARQAQITQIASTYFHQDRRTDLGIFDPHVAQIVEMQMIADEVIDIREATGAGSRRNPDASPQEASHYNTQALMGQEEIDEWIHLYNKTHTVSDPLAAGAYKGHALEYNLYLELERLNQERVGEHVLPDEFQEFMRQVYLGEKIDALEALSAILIPKLPLDINSANMMVKLISGSIEEIERHAMSSTTVEDLVGGRSDLSPDEKREMFEYFSQLTQVVDYTQLTERGKKVLRESISRRRFYKPGNRSIASAYFWIDGYEPGGIFDARVAQDYEAYLIAQQARLAMNASSADRPRYANELREWIDEYNNHYNNLHIDSLPEEDSSKILENNARALLAHQQKSLDSFVSSDNEYADKKVKQPIQDRIVELTSLLMFLRERDS